jgi:hypothetical protein
MASRASPPISLRTPAPPLLSHPIEIKWRSRLNVISFRYSGFYNEVLHMSILSINIKYNLWFTRLSVNTKLASWFIDLSISTKCTLRVIFVSKCNQMPQMELHAATASLLEMFLLKPKCRLERQEIPLVSKRRINVTKISFELIIRNFHTLWRNPPFI